MRAAAVQDEIRRTCGLHRMGEVPKVYGVPRGGCAVAAMIGEPVDHPVSAHAIVDDLIDSGATRDRYASQFPNVPFFALYEKQPGDDWLEFPWEQNEAPATDAVVRLLQAIGEDPAREGLVETPHRVVKALRELTEGYHMDLNTVLAKRFTENVDEMIVVRDIEFWSLCEHHMLPFSGVAHVGYIPQGKVVGLSKIPRVVHAFSRRLQVQERLTREVAEAIEGALQPRGVGVIFSGHHTCMAMRGVRTQGAMVTSSLLGAMREGPPRSEFLRLAGYGG